MLMQRHSKRLAFGTQDPDFTMSKNEIELAQENADVSAFAGLPSDEDDEFERDEEYQHSNDSIVQNTDPSLHLNEAEANALLPSTTLQPRNNRYQPELSESESNEH